MEREHLNNIDSETAILLREYTRQISEAVDVDSVYVFGSTVKNKQTETSDVDIALVLKGDVDSASKQRSGPYQRKVQKDLANSSTSISSGKTSS